MGNVICKSLENPATVLATISHGDFAAAERDERGYSRIAVADVGSVSHPTDPRGEDQRYSGHNAYFHDDLRAPGGGTHQIFTGHTVPFESRNLQITHQSS